MAYNGGDAENFFRDFKEKHANSPEGCGAQYFFGQLSETENTHITDSLSGILWDYLEDVADGKAGPELHLCRSDTRLVTPAARSAPAQVTSSAVKNPTLPTSRRTEPPSMFRSGQSSTSCRGLRPTSSHI